MKNLLLSVLTFLTVVGAVAQSADMYNAGNTAYKAKNYQEAIDNYEQYITLEEITPQLAKTLGACYFKLKKYEKAKEYYNQALELKYNKPLKLHVALIACYSKQKDVDGKLAQLEQSHKEFPNYKKFSVMLTNHYFKAAQLAYQEGGKIISEAYDKYLAKNKKAEYKKAAKAADTHFLSAKADLEKALSYSPNDAKSTTMLKDIETKLKGN